MEGYIKLHRKIIEWEWYTEPLTAHLFKHLILMASHSDKKYRGKEVKRGDVISSYRSLSVQTGLTIQEVRTRLNKLEKTGEITRTKNKDYTHIHIINYDKYQDVQQTTNIQSNTQITHDQHTANTQLTTIKNVKNVKNINNILAQNDKIAQKQVFISLPLKDGSLFDFYEVDIVQWEELYPSVDVRQELRNMKGWLLSNENKQKTRRGIKRFINSWLSRQQSLVPKIKSQVDDNDEEELD